MNCYRIVLLSRAADDLDSIANWLSEKSAEAGRAWLHGFLAAIRSLELHPQRCGLAPEGANMPYELRQNVYRFGKRRRDRVIFVIAHDEVRILRIRGAGQEFLAPDDLV